MEYFTPISVVIFEGNGVGPPVGTLGFMAYDETIGGVFGEEFIVSPFGMVVLYAFTLVALIEAVYGEIVGLLIEYISGGVVVE